MLAHVITGETSPLRLGILKFYAKRFGCGLCSSHCPNGATTMV